MDAPTGLATCTLISTIGGITIVALQQRHQFRLAQNERNEVKTNLEKKDGKLEEIHTLVNSRLTEALDEIKSLKGQLTISRRQKNKPRGKR